MSRKEIKIAAKQALETWEARWNDICSWDSNDIPQAKQDEFADLAMHSSAEIREALENIIALQTNFEAPEESRADDLSELREELASSLKETLNYRNSITAYTREALFAEVGDLDELVDVNLLFIDDEVVHEDIINQLPDDRTEHHDMVDGDIEESDEY